MKPRRGSSRERSDQWSEAGADDAATAAARERVGAVLEGVRRTNLGVIVAAPPDATRMAARDVARAAASVAGRGPLLHEALAATREAVLQAFAGAGFSGTWAATEMGASVAGARDRVAASAAFEEAAMAAVVEDLDVDEETLDVLRSTSLELTGLGGLPMPGSLSSVASPAAGVVRGPIQVAILGAVLIACGVAGFAIGSVSGLIVVFLGVGIVAALARRESGPSRDASPLMPPELAGVLAVAGLILVKEAGIPIPVPGDLVVIGAGVAAGRGDFDPVIALVAIVAASLIGGILQYGLLRSVARPALLRLLGRLGSADRIDRQTERLREGGARSVAIARSTPGVRIVAIAASALAGIPAAAFIAGLTIGNALFISAHFALGYLIGEPVVTAVGGLLGPLAIGFVGLAVVGGIGWYVIRRRRGVAEDPMATAMSWTDACCPACLALAAADRSPA